MKTIDKNLNIGLLIGNIIFVVISVLAFLLFIYFLSLVVSELKVSELYSSEYGISFSRNLTIILLLIPFIFIILILKNIILDSIRIIYYFKHENEILQRGERKRGIITGFKCDFGRRSNDR